MRKQQRPETKLDADQHKQHQQRDGHHNIWRHHHHKQHAADKRFAAKAVTVQRHGGQRADKGGEGRRQHRHGQRVLGGLQQAIVVHQQAIPVGGEPLPVDAEARPVKRVNDQNNNRDVEIRVDGGHKAAAQQSTDHSSSTFLFSRRAARQ